MKSVALFLALFFLNFNTAKAQITFEKTYSLQIASVGNSVKQTLDGGYVIGGTYVTKTNDSGLVEWIYPKPADYINTTADSGYIVIENAGDLFFTKLDKLGDTTWRKSYGAGLWAREGNAIEQTADGGYIVAGRFQDFSGSGMMMLKLNQQGVVSWRKTFSEPTSAAFAYGRSVHETADGGYIMAGHTFIDYYTSSRHRDVMLVKTDSLGNSQWTKYYGGTADENAYSVQITPSGYIVAGSQYDSLSSATNMFLLKLSTQGDTLWTKTFGGSFESEFKSVGLTTDGGYILTGSSNISSSGGTSNVSVFKVDSAGNIKWTKEFGGSNADKGNEILQTTDGGYILTGLANSNSTTNGVMYLIKMDSLGNIILPLSILPNHLPVPTIKLYPNPTSGTITVETEIENTAIHIYNLAGMEVQKQILSAGSNTLHFNALAKGIYIYRINKGLDSIEQGKIYLK